MNGTECKRCKEPDTFDTFCDVCDDHIFKRTNRLIARSRNAKNQADEVCKLLGIDNRSLEDVKEVFNDKQLAEAFAKHIDITPGTSDYKKFLLCEKLIRCEDARDGWAELAMMSNRIPYDDDYLREEIESARFEVTDN